MLRRSAREGFVVRRSDDDAFVNVTLLEKLRGEYGIDAPELADVPVGEAGVDVELVLRRFREVIKDLDRWDVLDRAALALFSFADNIEIVTYLIWPGLLMIGIGLRRRLFNPYARPMRGRPARPGRAQGGSAPVPQPA